MNRMPCPWITVLAFVFAASASAGNKDDVFAAMEQWRQKLAEACAGKPEKVAALYARDAVLWGTLSATMRSDPAAILDYFAGACRKLPKLTVEFRESRLRIYGDTAVNSGSYVFSFEQDGAMKTLPARFSFMLVKRSGQWLIADHHSSAMPAN
jgi:uncharacterized protein (TIGR02246 family)